MPKKTNCTINGKAYFRKYVTLGGKRKMIYGESEKDWQRKVDELKRCDALGIIMTNETVGDGLQRYIYEILPQNPNLKPSTYSIHESIYRGRIAFSDICKVKLMDCKTVHVQTYINKEVEAGRSPHAIQMVYRVLNMFFRYMVQEGYLFKNPCANAMRPKLPKTKEIQVYSDEDLKKLVDSMYTTRYRFLFLTMVSCGLRIGEALALEPDDFDWKNGMLHITKQQQNVRTVMDRKGSVSYENKDVTPKTEHSVRDIPLPGNLKREYDMHMRMCKEEYLRRGKGFKNTDKLFVTEGGLRCQQAQISVEWKKISMKAGVDHKNLHCLRHTYITKQIQSGKNIVAVMELAGHTRLDTTLRYTHIESKFKTDASGILDGIL